MQDLAKMTPEKKLQFEKSDLWEQITSSIDTTKRMKRNDCVTPIDKGQLISDWLFDFLNIPQKKFEEFMP